VGLTAALRRALSAIFRTLPAVLSLGADPIAALDANAAIVGARFAVLPLPLLAPAVAAVVRLLALAAVGALETGRALATLAATAVGAALLTLAVGLAGAVVHPTFVLGLVNADLVPHRLATERVEFAHAPHDFFVLAAREIVGLATVAFPAVATVLGARLAVLPDVGLAEAVAAVLLALLAFAVGSAEQPFRAFAAFTIAAVVTALLVLALGHAYALTHIVAYVAKVTLAALAATAVGATLLAAALRLAQTGAEIVARITGRAIAAIPAAAVVAALLAHAFGRAVLTGVPRFRTFALDRFTKAGGRTVFAADVLNARHNVHPLLLGVRRCVGPALAVAIFVVGRAPEHALRQLLA